MNDRPRMLPLLTGTRHGTRVSTAARWAADVAQAVRRWTAARGPLPAWERASHAWVRQLSEAMPSATLRATVSSLARTTRAEVIISLAGNAQASTTRRSMSLSGATSTAAQATP
ncbi:hypothetical protein FBZ33_0099 [Micromonospora sp. A202]|nr:hypothetical protein FBZ33_0099 [Micromonospora sp. A202]